jgi:hypothetical protein
VNVLSPVSATATFNVSPGAAAGVNNVTVATPAGASNAKTFSIFPVISTINPGQSIPGALETTDGRNPFSTSLYADLYQLTLGAPSTQVTIDMGSAAFAPFVYLLSASGATITSGNTQIVATLSAGTYYVVASSNTSVATGPYTISLNAGPGVKRMRAQTTSQ